MLKNKLPAYFCSKHIRAFTLGVVVGVLAISVSTEAAMLWGLFLGFLFFRLDKRILGSIAIMFLATCPFLLAFSKTNLAEQAAVYAYYLLVMSVILQIVEHWQEGIDRQSL